MDEFDTRMQEIASKTHQKGNILWGSMPPGPPRFFGCVVPSILGPFEASLDIFYIPTLFHNLALTGLLILRLTPATEGEGGYICLSVYRISQKVVDGSG